MFNDFEVALKEDINFGVKKDRYFVPQKLEVKYFHLLTNYVLIDVCHGLTKLVRF